MNRTFLAAAILALSSAASAAIEHRRVTVEGTNDDYTPSGLTLKKGDFVLVSATGSSRKAKRRKSTAARAHVSGRATSGRAAP